MEQEDKNLQAQPSETQEKPEKQPLPNGYEAYLSLFDLVRMLAVITLFPSERRERQLDVPHAGR